MKCVALLLGGSLWLLAPAAGFLSAQQAGSPETTVLFDGSNLDQWRGYHQEAIGQGWKIEGDELVFDGSGGGDIVTRRKFGDFVLDFEWAVSDGANSGVMYRVALGDNAPYLTGPEYQILDDQRHGDGKNKLTSAASLYGLYVPEGSQLKPAGQWNTARIVMSGDRVQHWLNGVKVVDAEIDSDDWDQRVAKSKFANWDGFGVNRSGHICLQDHGDPVRFRNMTIKAPSSAIID